MPIQWRGPGAPRLGPQVLRVPPSRFVRFLGDHSSVAQVLVHWAGERSQPCLGPECPHCPAASPARWIAYAPVLVYVVSSQGPRWVPAILPITEAISDLAEGDRTKKVWEISRSGGKRYGRLQAGAKSDAAPAEGQPFDVRPHLLRMWGMYAALAEFQARADGAAGPAPGAVQRPVAQAVLQHLGERVVLDQPVGRRRGAQHGEPVPVRQPSHRLPQVGAEGREVRGRDGQEEGGPGERPDEVGDAARLPGRGPLPAG